jgi:nucleotide-binding universal stress UspA family protein
MFNNIVIGIDGRQGGHSAVALARRLAGVEAELTLANVYGTRMIPGRGAAAAMAWESDASEALLKRERERAVLPDADLLRSSERSVGRGLHDLAEYVNADLLVVGATHRQPAARALIGDDTASVLHDAPCPVAIARVHDQRTARPSAVGVGYDGTPESSHALATARALAEDWGTTLQVLAVVPVHVRPYWERPPHPSPEAELAEAHLAGVPELHGLEVRVIEGNPFEQLTMWSQNLDLLVLGTRGQGLVGRLLTGSVSRHLALHSNCPLLICPRSASPMKRSIGSDALAKAHH